jgi:uncharacterized protein
MTPGSKHAEFSISVADLDAGGKAYDVPIPAEWLRTIFEDTEAKAGNEDGHLAVQLSKSGTDVVVHGRAKAKVELQCGRCLEPVHMTLAPEISALMVPAAKLKHPTRGNKDGEIELGPGDADVMPYDGDTVVLDDLVRDELVLDIPMIPLCSESCAGIPTPAKEAEPAVDPRFAPLLALKKKTKKE